MPPRPRLGQMVGACETYLAQRTSTGQAWIRTGFVMMGFRFVEPRFGPFLFSSA